MLIQKTVYTSGELAKLLSITPCTVYAIMKRGEMRHFRVGKKWMARHEDVVEYLGGQKNFDAMIKQANEDQECHA